MSEAPSESCAGLGCLSLSVLAFAGSPISLEAVPEASRGLSCCCISKLPLPSRLSEEPLSLSLQEHAIV